MVVRIIDLWTVKERNDQLHIQLIIQDAKGHKIQVITHPRDYKHWVDVLTEHESCTLYNGEPLKNDLPFKACENNLKLMFTTATTMRKHLNKDIPPHQYAFLLCCSLLHWD
ncbi:unnamed protein product [Lathyrus sativus]|nr:unnamed protein product [Lathyrus sativus]